MQYCISILLLCGAILSFECRADTGNVIKNGDFKLGTEGWTVDKSSGPNSYVRIYTGKDGKYANIFSGSSSGTTYLLQELNPKQLAGKTMLLSFWVKTEKMVQGKLECSHARLLLTGTSKKDVLLQYTGTTPWTKIEKVVSFDKNCQKSKIYLGIHSTVGRVMFRQISLKALNFIEEKQVADGVTERRCKEATVLNIKGRNFLEEKPVLPVSRYKPDAAEQKRGFVVFQTKEPLEVVAGRLPLRKEVINTNRKTSFVIQAAAGQYEPLFFAASALRPIKEMSLKISDLTASGGAVIPASDVELRMGKQTFQRAGFTELKYRIVPKMMVKAVPKGLTPDCPRLFMVNFHIPDNAVPGKYFGQITIQADQQIIPLKLQVNVLPFKLEPCKPWMFFYYDRRLDNLDKYFQDMREHGMTSVILAQVGVPLKREGNRVVMDFTLSDGFVDAYKKAGFTGPLVYNPFHDRLGTLLLELFDRGSKFKKTEAYGETIYKFKNDNYPEDLKKVYKQVIRDIYSHAKQKQWPEFLIFPVDEPEDPEKLNDSSWRLDAAEMEYPLIKEAVPSASTFCTAYSLPAVKRLSPNLDNAAVKLPSLLTDPSFKNYRDSAGKAGGSSDLWGIAWPAMWDDFSKARQCAGFLPVRAGCNRMTAWTYYLPDLWTDEYQDLRTPQKGCFLTYRLADGTLIPTLPFEGIRSGVNDWRYFITLEKAVAESTGDKRVLGKKLLRDIRSKLPAEYNDFSYGKMRKCPREGKLRNEIINAILKLKQP